MDGSLTAFRRDLDDLKRDVTDTRQATAEATQIIADDAAERAPRLSGYLAENIRGYGDHVEAEADYSLIVHEGLANQPGPRRFLDDAVATEEYLAPYADHIEHALDRQIRPRY